MESTNKAIIVINVPDNVGKIGVVDLSSKPSWCPLKPMPDGVTKEETGAYVKGFHDALISEVEDESNISS